MTQVFIGLGSNLAPEKHIAWAIDALLAMDPRGRCSTLYESEPVGFEGPNFYNGVFELDTSLTVSELKAQLKRIEVQFGKDPDAKKFQNRTLDLDLLVFGDLIQTEGVVLPRPDIFQYAFVLLPLSELAPDQIIPGTHLTYAQAWENFKGERSLWAVSHRLEPFHNEVISL